MVLMMSMRGFPLEQGLSDQVSRLRAEVFGVLHLELLLGEAEEEDDDVLEGVEEDDRGGLEAYVAWMEAADDDFDRGKDLMALVEVFEMGEDEVGICDAVELVEE